MMDELRCEMRVDYQGDPCDRPVVAVLSVWAPTLILCGLWACEAHVREAQRLYPRQGKYPGTTWTGLYEPRLEIL